MQTQSGQRTGRPCRCCTSPRLAEIDAAIVSGASLHTLSSQFGLTKQSIARHRDQHMPQAVLAAGVEAAAEAEAERGIDLLAEARSLLRAAQELMVEARADGDRTNAIRANLAAGRHIEMCGKLLGQIDDSTTINVLVSPALAELQAVVIAALAPYPAARLAVANALGQLTSGPLTIDHGS